MPPNTPATVHQATVWDRVAVALLGAAGCTLSYDALQQIAIAIHIRPALTYLFPLIIDGFIAYGVRALLVLRNAPFRARRLYVWTLFATATLASVWANALHAVRLNQLTPSGGLHLDDTTVGILSTIAPLALAGAVHLHILITRADNAPPTTGTVTQPETVQHQPEIPVGPGQEIEHTRPELPPARHGKDQPVRRIGRPPKGCPVTAVRGWDDLGVAGVLTASEPSWIAPFTGLSPRAFGKLVTVLRREGADAVRKGRPWGLPLEDRALLVAAYWRTNLTMRQLAPLFGVSKSAADRIIDHLGPMLALQPRKRFAKDAVLIVDGTLVPTRDHTVAEPSKNYRYSTNHQVVIDADTRLVVVVGRPLAGNRNDCKAWEESGAKAAVGNTLTISDGGYPGTGLVMPHRRRNGEDLPEWKQAHNTSHKQVRARVEHVFARMKTWKILRDCRLKGDGVHHAMLGIARMHNLALAG